MAPVPKRQRAAADDCELDRSGSEAQSAGAGAARNFVRRSKICPKISRK
jgi:hypothetical protein